MGDITAHFSRHEFDCHDGTPYPGAWLTTRLTPLCEALEVIREVACEGHPIVILCGFRTRAYNAHTPGAAPQSRHVQGDAADITCYAVPPKALWERVRALALAGRIDLGGLGRYDNRIHVDRRPHVPRLLIEWDFRTARL